EPVRNDGDKDAGTEGQAGAATAANGPEDGPAGWGAVDWRTAEETVRRLRRRIFTASQAGGLKRGRNLAEADAPVPAERLCEPAAAGDGGQCWPQDRGCRRGGGADSRGQGRPGRVGAAPGRTVGGPPGQAGVYRQAGQRRQAAPARYPGDRRQGAASRGGERAGTR